MTRLRSNPRFYPGHVRRLEALRRAGIVERVADGVWTVPADLVDRGKACDQKRRAGVKVELHSTLPIEEQVRAIGATWLDRQLVAGGASTLTTGFGALTRQAVIDRVDFLVEQGLARPRGNRAHGVLAFWTSYVTGGSQMSLRPFSRRDSFTDQYRTEAASAACIDSPSR